jgi:predicted PurR-regulated permease PerM
MSTKRAYFWLLVSVIAFGLIYALSDVLAPFVTGMTIAYLINPIVTSLSKRRIPRSLASLLVLIGFVVVVAGLLAILSPMIGKQALEFLNNVPDYITKFQGWLTPYMNEFLGHFGPQEVANIREAAGGQIGNVLKGSRDVFLKLWSGGMAVVDILMLLAITPVVAFYCLRDWPRIVAKVQELFPRDSAATLHAMFTEFDMRLAGFLRGQLLVCLSLGTIYGVSLSVVGLNFGLAIGFAAGILSFIPYIGSIFGFIASVGVALAQFPGYEMALVVMAIFFIGQFIEGNFLTPKLVGDRIGLHPVWVIFALMSGGTLFGFTGLLLAVPIAAMVGVVVRYGLIWYQQSAAYQGSASV